MRRSLATSIALGSLFAASCSSSAPVQPEKDPGALIKTTMTSQVGVLLDELPADMRDRAATSLLAQPSSYWEARAQSQISLTLYRLVFRQYYYDDKQQLPLPPRQAWKITLDGKGPQRTMIDGHDVVAVGYTYTSTLLSDVDSPAKAEPALAKAGGTWDEPFFLPVDPELIFQRTGYACMDESEFPPNSVDGENVATFYDQDCTVAPPDCHVTKPYPAEDCTYAVKAHIGHVDTKVHFERLAWDATAADAARVEQVTHPEGADLAVIGEGLDNNRLIYRYIPADSCAIAEGCVGGPGWRRLLQFDASVKNLGGKALDIGDVDYFISGAGTTLGDHHIYEFSQCHMHYHFTHYGKFTYGTGSEQTGQKKAFCLQSTSRYANNESSPLTNPYGSCSYQGIEAGWGDDYGAGLDCQWIDVTAVNTAAGPVTQPLKFVSNPDQFLCEGTPVLDAAGHPTFEPTDFKTMMGETVDRPVCDFVKDWNANNTESRDVTVPPTGGFVTAPCTRGQVGPLRDCGFTEQITPGDLIICTPGAAVELDCSIADATVPQVLRVCERSAALGTGVACTYRDALANTIVTGASTKVSLTCPAARDSVETGGLVALYTQPVLDGDKAQKVTCTVK
ncbi:MAG: lysyl oxidase family protein [Minicystis sp.]